MDFKVNEIQQTVPVQQTQTAQPTDDSFKLIKEFMNEIVNRSHKFSRENFLDRRGRHRVYGIIRLVDEKLDELAQELVNEESDKIAILARVDEIRGLLLDIFA